MKTALGIDISEGLINLALVEKNSNGFELLKSASAAVPDGAIKDGSVENIAILAKAINKLKAGSKIHSTQTAVSLLAGTVLIQIMYMPQKVPTNIKAFLQNEVKDYAILRDKKIALDFFRIGSDIEGGSNRLFVVAADSHKATGLVEACTQAGLDVKAIGLPLLAYARYCGKKITGKSGCNLLIAMLRNNILTLCVFRNQTIDFVRTRSVDKENRQPDKFRRYLADEINAVIQCYDVEAPDSLRKWQVTAIADSVLLPADAEESLKTEIINADIRVRPFKDICQGTFIEKSLGAEADKPSLVAVGLAEELLEPKGSNLKINLLPPEMTEAKSIRKHALITANIVAAIPLIMILAVGGLNLMIENVNGNIQHKKQTNQLQQTYALLTEQESIDGQINTLSGKISQMNKILSLHNDIDWAPLLDEVRSKTPETVRITRLLSKGDAVMLIEGLALSYDAAGLFADMLDKSEYIDSASLIESVKDDRSGGLVRYVINCSLSRRKGK